MLAYLPMLMPTREELLRRFGPDPDAFIAAMEAEALARNAEMNETSELTST